MNSQNKKILIIDDDARNIFALSAVLRSKGYSCISALSASEGLNLLSDTRDIGIVLVDMMMPEMDGYTVIPKIKQDKDLAGIPVIAVTAQAMPGDKERCLSAGADGYISKPVNVDVLLEILSNYLK
jgi:CheY-like chemotaxis protein